MNAAIIPINRRITLQLDVAIVFEALILTRLAHLPKVRHREWLRSLLVQGFQRECRALRKVQRNGRFDANVLPTSQTAAVNQTVSEAGHQGRMPQMQTSPPAQPAALPAQHSGNTVSFAALRKVIG